MDLLKHTIDVEEDYYEISSILATNSSVSVIFKKDTPKVGQTPPDSIPERGYKTEVPAWLLPDLRLYISVPRIYNQPHRQALKADAKAINFQSIENGRHFYKLGAHIAKQVGGNQGREIAQALLDSFSQRCEKIVRESIDPDRKPEKFDESEKKVFEIGQKAERDMSNWIRNVDKTSLKRKHQERTVLHNRWNTM